MRVVTILVIGMIVSLSALGAPNEYVAVSQASLDDIIDRADRLVIRNDGRSDAPILYQSKQRKDLTGLKESLRIEIPPKAMKGVKDFKGIFCPGVSSPLLCFYSGHTQIGTVGILADGYIVHLSRWEWDAKIADREKLEKWFKKRNIRLSQDQSKKEK